MVLGGDDYNASLKRRGGRPMPSNSCFKRTGRCQLTLSLALKSGGRRQASAPDLRAFVYTTMTCNNHKMYMYTYLYRVGIFSGAMGLFMVNNIILSPSCGRLWSKQTRPRESTANFGSRTGCPGFRGAHTAPYSSGRPQNYHGRTTL